MDFLLEDKSLIPELYQFNWLKPKSDYNPTLKTTRVMKLKNRSEIYCYNFIYV